MAIDTHLDATPSEITSSATAIGNIETHVDSAEDDLISARKNVVELEGDTAFNASIAIGTEVNNCEDLVSDLKSYKNALTNFATAMGSRGKSQQGDQWWADSQRGAHRTANRFLPHGGRPQ